MKHLMIAGPCALESRDQLRTCIETFKEMGLTAVRASLWKPRTCPGWEGLGEEGIPILLEEAVAHEIMAATEVIYAEQAELLIGELRKRSATAPLLLWIGARNQNHMEQKKIADVINCDPHTLLMVKNQVWEDERHWLGILEHILETGFPKERLLSCHRGFAMNGNSNPNRLRNRPHFEMAMRVKMESGISMVLDPSHIGGTRENVKRIMEMAKSFQFDGSMVEVHPQPENALTDAKQQLSLAEFQSVMRREKVA